MTSYKLSNRTKAAMTVCFLISLSFLILAVVTFKNTGDWPARYISAGVLLLALMFAIRKRALRRR